MADNQDWVNNPVAKSDSEDSDAEDLQAAVWKRGCPVEVCMDEDATDWVKGTVEWVHDDGDDKSLRFDIRYPSGNTERSVPQRFVRHVPVPGNKRSAKSRAKDSKRTKKMRRKQNKVKSNNEVAIRDGDDDKRDLHWTGKFARVKERVARGYNDLLALVCDIGRALDTALEGGRFLTYKFVLM